MKTVWFTQALSRVCFITPKTMDGLGESLKASSNCRPKKDWAFPPRPSTHFVRWITPSYFNRDHIAISSEAGAVLNTHDYGKTWKDRPEESPINVHTLLMNPKAPNRLYEANGDESLRKGHSYAESHDEVTSWVYMSEGLDAHPYLYNMVIHPENPNDRLVSASRIASYAHGSKRYSTIYRKIDDEPGVEVAEGLLKEQAYTHHLANDQRLTTPSNRRTPYASI